MGWSHFFIRRKAEVIALFAKSGFISEVTFALEDSGSERAPSRMLCIHLLGLQEAAAQPKPSMGLGWQRVTSQLPSPRSINPGQPPRSEHPEPWVEPAPACTGAAPHCHQAMKKLGLVLVSRHFLQCCSSCHFPWVSNVTESESWRMQLHTITLISQNQAQHASFRVYWQSAKIQGSKEI